MPKPNYPEEFGTEWNRLTRKVRDAFTAAQSRVRFGRISATNLEVVGDGGILVEDSSAEKVFEVTAEPPDIFMRPELISTVARQVIGESVFFDVAVAGSGRTAFDTYGDLEQLGSPDPGPSVTFDLSGTEFLAIWGARAAATVNTVAGQDRVETDMSVEVSGPTPEDPDSATTAHQDVSFPDAPNTRIIDESPASGRKFTEMLPGNYTVTAKYRFRNNGSNSLSQAHWQGRWLIVIAF